MLKSLYEIKKYRAFSLVELSIVILVIGILIAAITKGGKIYNEIKIKAAQSVTSSSRLNSMNDLVLWLETSFFENITTRQNDKNPQFGDNVKSWRDSRIARDSEKIYLTQDNEALQPLLIKDGIGGLPSIEFDGDILKSLKTPLRAGDKTYTLVAIWQANYANLSGRMIFSQDGGSVYDMAALFIPSPSKIAFAGNNCDMSTAISDIMAENILIVTINNNLTQNAKMYINSNNPVVGTSDNGSCASIQNMNLSDQQINIGSRSYGDQLFRGKISEILVFDRDLSQKEVEEINNYFNQKYGIKLK